MKKLILLALGGALLAGCIANRSASGLLVNLYAWDDRINPIAIRLTSEFTGFGGLFNGDIIFTDILEELPNLDTSPDTPYLVEFCEGDVCHYLVVFPAFLSQNAAGEVGGFGALSSISTLLYHEVKELPAGEVRAALDALADRVVSTEISDLADGSIDYRDIFGLDYERYDIFRVLLLDQDLPDQATAALADGSEATLSQVLDGDTGGDDGGGIFYVVFDSVPGFGGSNAGPPIWYDNFTSDASRADWSIKILFTPEPGSGLLTGMGLLGLVAFARRRARK